MASNRNIPQKGSGSNQPDKKQSIDADAASVDWMIMSDFSTRIGGYSEPNKEVKNSAANPSPKVVNNQSDLEDLEDLEWLRSLGLDNPIEHSSGSRNDVSSGQNDNQNIENADDIDWLIVSDTKTRMDSLHSNDSVSGHRDANISNKKYQPSEESNSFHDLDNILGEDLGLDDLDFSGASDFSSLNSSEFDNSENFIGNELQNDLDITEGKIRELSGLFENSFDSDNNSNDDWEEILGSSSNGDSQFSSSSNLGIVEDSFEIPTQITGFIDNSIDESKKYFDDDAYLTSEILSQEDVLIDSSADLFVNELETSEVLTAEINLPPEVIKLPSKNDFSDDFNNLNDNDVDSVNSSYDDVFDSDWAQSDRSSTNAIDDSIWGVSDDIASESVPSGLIDDAFGTSDDWAIASPIAQSAAQLSGLEEDIDFGSPTAAIVEHSFDQAFGVISDNQVFDEQVEVANSEIDSQAEVQTQADIDADIDNDASWSADLEAEIDADNSVNLDWELESEVLADEETPSDDDSQWGAESSISSTSNDLEIDETYDDDWNAKLESEASIHEEFDFGESLNQSSELDSRAFAKQITDSDFTNDFTDYVVKPTESNDLDISFENSETPDEQHSDDFANITEFTEFKEPESITSDDFELADFDLAGLPEISSNDDRNNNFATTLTPNRAIAVPPPSIQFTNNLVPPKPSNFFEEALNDEPVIDFIDDYDLELDSHQEALANDLLNGGYTSELSVLDNRISEKVENPTPSSFENFDVDTSDRDFLDDFDLDSLDTHVDGDDFGSAFVPPALIPTSLTPSSPPVFPSVNDQELITPTINNPPLPPPFLPPLPPKRNPNQAKKPPYSSPSVSKPASNPLHTIDEDWSKLLDAETVLSGGVPTASPYSDSRGSMPPRAVSSTGSSAAKSSQDRGRDYNSFSSPKRKDTGIPDFNDLGLEVHDDNTDWSGLLDSEDMSDDITSISTGSQLPSRVRSTPIRNDITGTSETREIPRDRRKPASSFDSTQARMSAMPDQVDFNRFTDDNYGYETPLLPPEAVSPSRKLPKITMPSVSLESLWQNYLKIPAIGLGAIAGVFLLYNLVNRPVFDIGLRWGIFKDASGKDFTNADFKGAKLDNVDFSKANLTGAKMQDASLVGANFQNATLDGVNFTNANLNRARLIQASVVWAEFNKAQMNLVDLEGSDLTLSNFANAKMEGANLLKSKIGAQGTDKATKFSSTLLLAWQIVNEPREGRNLSGQDLSGLNLSFSNLKRANLSNTKLNYTDLTGADVRGANLTGGQVNGANWSGAKLAGINLTDVNFDKSKLPKTDEETICPNSKKGPCKF